MIVVVVVDVVVVDIIVIVVVTGPPKELGFALRGMLQIGSNDARRRPAIQNNKSFFFLFCFVLSSIALSLLYIFVIANPKFGPSKFIRETVVKINAALDFFERHTGSSSS